jgi:uncharacterized protein (TIGR03435 family)
MIAILRQVVAVLALATFGVQVASTVTPETSFEVASIKANNDSAARPVLAQRGPGTFVAQSSTVRNLIRGGYGVRGFQVVGGPDWIDSDRFDINAKLQTRSSVGGDEWPLVEAALQHLLAVRFGLKVHRDMRLVTQLVVRRAKGAAPLVHRDGSCVADNSTSPVAAAVNSGYCGTIRFTRDGSIIGGAVSMGSVVGAISSLTGQPVQDDTGVTGAFDVAVTWVPDEVGGALFTALRDQLGLVVSSERRPIEVIVVDDVRRPTPD